jgi:hypothetical protein
MSTTPATELDKRPPLPPEEKPDPHYDGVDHINVYSRGRTVLGQELSNFAHQSLQHPKYGFFASVEALWYWLSTGMQHDHLRRLYAASAKTAGIRLAIVPMDQAQFNDTIRDGLRLKIVQNPKLYESLKKSTLPLRHYYVYGANPFVIRESKKHLWQMVCLEEIRSQLKNGVKILLTDGTAANTRPLPEIIENPIPDDIPRQVED